MKKKYAIIAALDYEVEIIRDALENKTEKTILGTPVYEGTIGECDVVAMRCGMAKVSAAIGTQALIDAYHPDYVINSGCAGALAAGLGIGDVVVSDVVVEWDLDLRAIGFPLGYIDALGYVEMKADAELGDRIAKAIPETERVFRGLIVSGDAFVSTDEQRKTIFDNFPAALCAEMEGAAVAQTCLQNGVPFCIIRAMSDTADHASTVDFATFAAQSGRKSAAWMLKMLRDA